MCPFESISGMDRPCLVLQYRAPRGRSSATSKSITGMDRPCRVLQNLLPRGRSSARTKSPGIGCLLAFPLIELSWAETTPISEVNSTSSPTGNANVKRQHEDNVKILNEDKESVNIFSLINSVFSVEKKTLKNLH